MGTVLEIVLWFAVAGLILLMPISIWLVVHTVAIALREKREGK